MVTLTICCRVHIFDTFSCGNKAVLILPRGQDRPVLPERVANIRSNFLPRGASLTIYYNYRIIKVACVQIPPPTPFSVMRGKPKKKSKTSTKCRSRKHKNNVQNSPANTKEGTKDDFMREHLIQTLMNVISSLTFSSDRRINDNIKDVQ